MKQLAACLFIFVCTIFIFPRQFIYAHQPRLVTGQVIQVEDPEISKAYYSNLEGVPQIFRIGASSPFNLYINVLVPDIGGQKKDVSAIILKDGTQIAVLDGMHFEWKKFFEPFGQDTYWMGPEYRAHVGAGEYEVKVSSPANDTRYALVIGETEAFDVKESVSALHLIPILKKNFFNESPIGFIKSPFGWGYILILYVLAFIVGAIYRFLLKQFVKRKQGVGNNIGSSDRLLRVALGVALLLWAVTTSWSPVILLISGLCLFEAVFSWCALYQALGKNTCPIS